MNQLGDPTNQDRAERAREPFNAYIKAQNEGHGLDEPEAIDLETEMVDFITDLMHLADELELDFAAVMNMAAGNHEAEALEEQPVACGCGIEVAPDARFFATPCGTFCEECFGVHAENCELCRKELG